MKTCIYIVSKESEKVIHCNNEAIHGDFCNYHALLFMTNAMKIIYKE